MSHATGRDAQDLLEVHALSPAALLKVALLERAVVLVTFVLTTLTVGIITLMQPRTFTARAAFRPTISRINLPSETVAPGFGVVPGINPTAPAVDYFVDLVESRGVLKKVAIAHIDSLMPGTGRNPGAIEDAIVDLSDDVTVSSDPRTGIVRLFVRTSSARLSKSVAESIIAEMDSLLERMRMVQSESERRFLDARRAELLDELHQSEIALQTFEERNRGGLTSASLGLEQARLERELTLKQTQFAELERTRFTTRLDAVRSTPFIGMIEPAEVPTMPDSRRLMTNIGFGGVLGLLLGLYMAFAKHNLVETRRRMQRVSRPT